MNGSRQGRHVSATPLVLEKLSYELATISASCERTYALESPRDPTEYCQAQTRLRAHDLMSLSSGASACYDEHAPCHGQPQDRANAPCDGSSWLAYAPPCLRPRCLRPLHALQIDTTAQVRNAMSVLLVQVAAFTAQCSFY